MDTRRFCTRCGAPVAAAARFCNACGAGTAASPALGTPPSAPRRGPWTVVVVAVLAFVAVAALAAWWLAGDAPDPTGGPPVVAPSRRDPEPPASDAGPDVAPRNARARTADAPPVLTQLVAESLQPSSAAQSVGVPGTITVTVPGGTLAAPAVLTVFRVDSGAPPPPPMLGAPGTVLDVSLGDLHEFAAPIEFTIPADPSRIAAGRAPENAVSVMMFDPVANAWTDLPCRWDAARGAIVASTRHLCLLTWWVLTSDCVKETFPEIVLYYSPEEIRLAHLGDKFWPAQHARPAVGTTPNFAFDVLGYAWDTISSYRTRLGLELHTKPLSIYVHDIGSPSEHNAFWEYVAIKPFCRPDPDTGDRDPSYLHYVVAHELFHNVELGGLDCVELGTHDYWLAEVCAEYAATRVAVPGFRWPGKADELATNRRAAATAAVLDHPIVSNSVPGSDSLHYCQAYRAAGFVEFLVSYGTHRRGGTPDDRAAFFARFWTSVAASLHGGPKREFGNARRMGDAVDAFIRAEIPGETFADVYTRFCAWHLLHRESWLRAPGGTETVPAEAVGLVSTTDALRPSAVLTFDLMAGPRAHVAELSACPEDGGAAFTIALELEEDAKDAEVFAAVLPGGRRLTGPLGASLLPALVRVEKGRRAVVGFDGRRSDRLYVVAANAGFDHPAALRVRLTRDTADLLTILRGTRGVGCGFRGPVVRIDSDGTKESRSDETGGIGMSVRVPDAGPSSEGRIEWAGNGFMATGETAVVGGRSKVTIQGGVDPVRRTVSVVGREERAVTTRLGEISASEWTTVRTFSASNVPIDAIWDPSFTDVPFRVAAPALGGCSVAATDETTVVSRRTGGRGPGLDGTSTVNYVPKLDAAGAAVDVTFELAPQR